MNRFGKAVAAATLGAVMGIATGAQGHAFWFTERSKQFAMVFGVGADDLDMVKRMPKVTSFNAYDADGKEVPSKLTVTGPLVLVDVANDPAIVTATMNYGIWSKAPDGEWYAKGKDEGLYVGALARLLEDTSLRRAAEKFAADARGIDRNAILPKLIAEFVK